MSKNLDRQTDAINSRHHHCHHHEDGADKFRRHMRNEKRRWQLAKQITFCVLCFLVAITFTFLIWSYIGD